MTDIPTPATTPNADMSFLIVDDEPANVDVLVRILKRAGYHHVRGTTRPRDVAALCAAQLPDVVLLDLHMPGMDGLQVMRAMRAQPGDLEPYVIILTGDVTTSSRNRALAEGARDFITKPFDRTEVLLRIRNLLDLRRAQLHLQLQNRDLEERVRQRTADLELARLDVVDRLALAAEFRDDATGQHTRRVGALAAAMCVELGMPEAEVRLIQRAAPLHDIGKIAIPDHVLLKPGPLSSDEYKIMQSHTTIGARLLANGGTDLLDVAQLIALGHHERWDGDGYPAGIRGVDIPVPARVVAVADFFDALVHDRPYRPACPVAEVRAMIRMRRGTHFDPDVVDAFFSALETRDTR